MPDVGCPLRLSSSHHNERERHRRTAHALLKAAAQRNGDGALHATGVASRVFLGSFLCGHGLIAELRMSSWTNAQVVDAVIAEMQWPDQLITAFRKISGPPNGARLADWDLQDALDWMDSDLGDVNETRRAAEYMAGELRIHAGPGG